VGKAQVKGRKRQKTENDALVRGRREPKMVKGRDDESLRKAVWLPGWAALTLKYLLPWMRRLYSPRLSQQLHPTMM
jgi:hypothetical protein